MIWYVSYENSNLINQEQLKMEAFKWILWDSSKWQEFNRDTLRAGEIEDFMIKSIAASVEALPSTYMVVQNC